MKTHLLSIIVFILLLLSCQGKGEFLCINVTNPSDFARRGEMVEVPMDRIEASLHLADTSELVVLDEAGTKIPCQLTYDQKLIFPVSLEANAQTVYRVQKGIPDRIQVRACGKVYPQRMDDLAWENDLMGFRAYGPALQARGEQGFGYDLFTKRGTDLPVLEKMYAMETDQETWTKIRELRKTDSEAAEKLRESITYHIDKGYGMDCYAVGPTLGAGVAALVDSGAIVYPWCYRKCEILDNGPLRFTAKLTFNPLTVKGKDDVIETRIITLDQGSHLNRTVITYSNLDEPMPVVTGIVLHNTDGSVRMDVEQGFITYEDPTNGPDQGRIFLGAAFPNEVKEAKVQWFLEEEKKRRNNACGHVLAFSEYAPDAEYTYYWGFGWSRADIPSIEAWNEYMAQAAQRIRQPLEVVAR